MKNEQKLLIALLGNIDGGEIEALLTGELNWEVFIETADKNRVVPMVFQQLKPFFSRLPPEISGELQDIAQACARHNLNCHAQTVRIAEALNRNKIEFIAYKGATLAQIAYGDPGLRQFTDLDILIHKKDFQPVKDLILDIGGSCAWKLSDKQEKAVLKYYYEYPFKLGKTPVLVEVHWTFMETFFGFDYDIEEVFRRRQTVSVRGRRLPTLSGEDLLIVLCVHGSKHFWKRLSWICDVGKLIETQSLDWEQVMRCAAAAGCLRMLRLGLRLARDLMKIEMPREIARQLDADREVDQIAQIIKSELFDETFSQETPRPRFHMRMRERWRDKFTYSHRLFKTKLIDSLLMPMGRPQ